MVAPPMMHMAMTHAEFWKTLWRTLSIAGASVAIASLIGLPLGLWLGRSRFKGLRAVWAAVYTGMALPPVVVGLLVYLLLSRSGPLGFWGWLYTPKAMVLAQVLLELPFIMGITMTVVSAVPRELHFQLRTLGAGEWRAKWTLLREASPGVMLALATAFGRSVSEVGAVWIVGGNIQDHTRVLTTAIVLETSRGQFAPALLLGSALLTLALLINVVMLRFQMRAAP